MDTAEKTLIFEMEGSHYALPLGAVREVIRSVTISASATSTEVEGYINLRGQVLPVVDIRHQLGLPASSNHPSHRLVMIDHGDSPIVIRSNSMPRISELACHRAPHGHSFIVGVGTEDSNVVELLNIDRICQSLHSDSFVVSGGRGGHD